MSTTNIETLREVLNDAQATLDHAERERDDWEPDSDNSGHTAPYDGTLDDCSDPLPDWLCHVPVSDLMREHNWSVYIGGFNDWEDGIRNERERRRTWSDFNELCEAVEEAEAARDDAQEAVDNADEAISTHPTPEE